MSLTPATVFAPPGGVTGYAAAAVAVLMVVLWLISIAIEDVSIVDPAWGPAFVLVALVCAIAGAGPTRWLLLALTAAWGLRLGYHLARRKLAEPGEDRRYAVMREREGSRFVAWSLVMIFGLQGLLVVIVSLPLQVAATRHHALTAAAIPGVLVFVIGLAFEAVGDAQLAISKPTRTAGAR